MKVRGEGSGRGGTMGMGQARRGTKKEPPDEAGGLCVREEPCMQRW